MRNPYTGYTGPCLDHERVWNGIRVDIGLEDEWLVALNSLDSFYLISICVGHETNLHTTTNQCPDIAIRYDRRKEYVSSSEEITAMISDMQKLSREVFPKHYFALNMSMGIKVLTAKNGFCEENKISLHIDVSNQFKTGLSSKKQEWFEMAVQKITEFDKIWTKEEIKYLTVDRKVE